MNPPATKRPRGKGKAASKTKRPTAPATKPERVEVSRSSLDHVLGVIRTLLLRTGGEVRLTIDDGEMVATLAVQLARRPRRVDPEARQSLLPGVEPTDDTSSSPERDEGRVEASAEIPTTSTSSGELDWRVIYYLPRRDWDRLGDVGRDQLHRPTGSPDPAEHVRWTVLATTARSEALREDEPRAAALGRLVERVGLHAVFAEAPRCKHCGCIATIPCVGGCRWATPAQDECSQCVEAHAALAEHLADQVVRLWCPLEGEGAASHVTWAGLHDGTCLDTTFATKHGVIVAWSYTGDGVTTFLPRWLADLYTERWPKVGWRAEVAAEGATVNALDVGTTIYAAGVDDPRGAAPGQRFDLIGVDAEAVRGRWGESDADEDITVDRLERVAASQRLDGLVPAFWRVRGSAPSQSRGAKRSPSQSASKISAGERALTQRGPRATLEALRVGTRVRISSSAGGIEGVPVSLAGHVGTVEKLGPKRVQVRPDGRDRAWSIPPHQLELVEAEAAQSAASAPSRTKRGTKTKPKPHREGFHTFDLVARTQSPNVACLIVVDDEGSTRLEQRPKGVTEVEWLDLILARVEARPEGTVARLYSKRAVCLWDSRDGGKP